MKGERSNNNSIGSKMEGSEEMIYGIAGLVGGLIAIVWAIKRRQDG